MKPQIAVVGDTHIERGSEKWRIAASLGRGLMDAGYRIVTGGLGDLPEAIAKGARASRKYRDGSLIAIVPGFDPSVAGEIADIVLATGMDQARNVIVANSDAVIAIGGGAGTLSEIAHAWSLKRLILAFDVPGWSGELAGRVIDGRRRFPKLPSDRIYKVRSSEEAVRLLKEQLPLYRKRHRGIAVRRQ